MVRSSTMASDIMNPCKATFFEQLTPCHLGRTPRRTRNGSLVLGLVLSLLFGNHTNRIGPCVRVSHWTQGFRKEKEHGRLRVPCAFTTVPETLGNRCKEVL